MGSPSVMAFGDAANSGIFARKRATTKPLQKKEPRRALSEVGYVLGVRVGQASGILRGIRGRSGQPHSPQLMRRYGSFRDPHGCANAAFP